jgi:leucyl aminopeptidase
MRSASSPAAVVDIATLTGACVIALGGVRSGLFSTNDELAAALLAAGEASQDPCWRMPLDDEYADGLKTNFADVANVAGRAGGAITAAKFLQRFTDKYALGPPGHRRHGLEGRCRQGLHRPAGAAAARVAAGTGRACGGRGGQAGGAAQARSAVTAFQGRLRRPRRLQEPRP